MATWDRDQLIDELATRYRQLLEQRVPCTRKTLDEIEQTVEEVSVEMERELERDVDMESVAEAVSQKFGDVFGREMRRVETVDALLGNIVGVPMKPPAELREMHGDDEALLA